MKTSNSLKNTIGTIASYLTAIVVGLVAQRFFIRILGTEFNGINGLFSNVISMLNIAELGIGAAIIYKLYKPLAENDHEKIKSLMRLIKNAYNIIIAVMVAVGLCIIPFLHLFVKNVTVDINITVVYLLFLASSVSTYICSYKRSILYADQKNYIINIIEICYFIAVNTVQLLMLYQTKNYYLYLAVKTIMTVLENLAITFAADYRYPFLKQGDAKKLEKAESDDIFIKLKAMFFHKIGNFVITGTDNIIVSMFLGVIPVGLYTNYYMILNAVNLLFGHAVYSVAPSVGSMLVTDSKEKCFSIFKKIRFINFWIAAFSATSILVIMQSWIPIWLDGSEFLLPDTVLYVLVFNFFQNMMQNTYQIFRDTAGIWHDDRFVPLVQALVNIVSSVILVKLMGLAGVFIGTIISSLVLWGFSFPKYIYKRMFDEKLFSYLMETLGYAFMFLIIAISTKTVSVFFTRPTLYAEFFKNLVICAIVPNVMIFLIYRRTENMQYIIDLLKGFLKRAK